MIDVSLKREKAELVIKDARYLNVFSGEILKGDIAIEDGVIVGLGEYDGKKCYYTDGTVVPGFIDGHVHVESSLVTPQNFADEAIKHGTTTVVCDPHEIANVAGVDGIKFMLADAKKASIDFKFMLPSCVPATDLDLNYGVIGEKDLRPLYRDRDVIGLAEVMDVPKTLACDGDMLGKIEYARRHGVVDGHAPSLTGKELCAYTLAGISSDHECVDPREAMEKLRLGQYIMVREGTAAKNLAALSPLIEKYPLRCLLVTDDLHPDYLVENGHIDSIIKKAIKLNVDPIKAITSATLTPALRFGLSDRGAIAVGRRADLAVLNDDFEVIDVFCAKRARRVAPHDRIARFGGALNARLISESDIEPSPDVIKLVGGQIVTDEGKRDDAVLFVCERHHFTGKKSACYIEGYGLNGGAVAMSIAHDSHNIIAAGSKADIVRAVNRLIEIGGGIVVSSGERTEALPLEIGGIMTDKSARDVAKRLVELKDFAYSLGVKRDIDPFMSLSFLSLPVIPKIRLLPSGVVRI